MELTAIPGGKEKGFSLIAEDKDGTPMKRTYAFSGYHVRVVSKVPVVRGAGTSPAAPDTVSTTNAAAAPATGSAWWQPGGWWQKASAGARRWFNR